MKTIRSHPSFKVGLVRLIDLTDVTEFDYKVGEAVSLSQEVKGHYREDEQPVKCAYLASTSLAFGMARMFATLLSDEPRLHVGVFRNEEDALSFLEVFDPVPSLPAYPVSPK